MHMFNMVWVVELRLKLTKSDKTFIQEMPVCRLATATEDCEPIVRPLWTVFDGVYIYFASDPDTPKTRAY